MVTLDQEKRRLLVAGCIFVVFAGGVLLACTLGVTWDESAYISAGYRHISWLTDLSTGSFSKASIDDYWGPNHEHPPAAKLVYGVAAYLTGDGSPMLSLLNARLAAVVIFTGLTGLIYLFVSRNLSRLAGFFAAAALPLMPRLLGHGSLAALDIPVAAGCFAAAMLFYHSGDRDHRAIIAGIIWGVALLTKLNAVFMPIVLVPWGLFYWRRKAIRPLVIFMTVGSLTFFAGWPWLWPQPFTRTANYVFSRASQVVPEASMGGASVVPVHYLGESYTDRAPPWHYPLVMVFFTVPAGLLFFAAAAVKNLGASVRTKPWLSFVTANAAVHIFIFCIPAIPKYDGVRLFTAAFPFLACLAGAGAWQVWQRVGRYGPPLVCTVYVLTAAFCVWTFPYQLSFYNSLAGTAHGAQKLGLCTTYWGDTIHSDVQEEVNEECRYGSLAIWPPCYNFWERPPWVSNDISYRADWSPGQREPEYLLVFRRQGYLQNEVGRIIREHRPVKQWKYMGVPQTELYALP